MASMLSNQTRNQNKMNRQIALNYFLDFVNDGKEENSINWRQVVHYGDPREATAETKLVIVPSSFFDSEVYGSENSLPGSPPSRIRTGTMGEIPVLFGNPTIERDSSGRKIVHADLVASSFFLLTRYEEPVRQEVRDNHGRFPGKESYVDRHADPKIPLVDLYREWFLELMAAEGVQVLTKNRSFSLILTHDIDVPFRYLYLGRTLGVSALQMLGKRKGNPIQAIKAYTGLSADPYDTFEWMNERFKDARKILGDRVRQIYFVMACDSGPYDQGYTVENKRVRELLKRLKDSGAEFGLHPSYKAGTNPEEIASEKKRLEDVVEMPITQTRHHYLRLREPSHTQWLIDAGFTDDYSAGYADVAGFRNGTSRPFRYFDLEKHQPTDFRIHPLPIMECTFEDRRYMNLNLDAATEAACKIAQASIDHQGELVLLWHNPTFSPGQDQYHQPFYQNILNYIYEQVAD